MREGVQVLWYGAVLRFKNSEDLGDKVYVERKSAITKNRKSTGVNEKYIKRFQVMGMKPDHIRGFGIRGTSHKFSTYYWKLELPEGKSITIAEYMEFLPKLKGRRNFMELYIASEIEKAPRMIYPSIDLQNPIPIVIHNRGDVIRPIPRKGAPLPLAGKLP